MANIVRSFVEDVLPVLAARKAALWKSPKVASRPNADRPALWLKPQSREPYRPAPDHHLRQSHL